MKSQNEEHKNEIFCPYHRGWIKDDFIGDNCSVCNKKIRVKCVICKKDFIRKEIGQRYVCYDKKCYKIFYEACASDNRFWQKSKQVYDKERYEKNRSEKRKCQRLST